MTPGGTTEKSSVSGGSGDQQASSGQAKKKGGEGGEAQGEDKSKGETRRMTHALVSISNPAYPGALVVIIMIVRFEDCHNRQMYTVVDLHKDKPLDICAELVESNLVSEKDVKFLSATIAEAFRKCVFKMALMLLRQFEVDIPPEIMALDPPPDADLRMNLIGARDQGAMDDLVKASNFGRLTTYFETDDADKKEAARKPEMAVRVRDFTGVSEAHPLPDGAFFCGPIGKEGSVPYRQAEASVNPFDITLLQAAIEAAGGAHDYFNSILPPGTIPNLEPPRKQQQQQQKQTMDGSGAATGSGAMGTPMNPSGDGATAAAVPNGGDTYQNLQSAQQRLEGLQQLNQQQVQQQQQQQQQPNAE